MSSGDVDIRGNLTVGGTLVPKLFKPPAGSITDAAVEAAAGIQATKLQHQHVFTHRQKTGADVATQTEDLFTVRAAGSVVGVDVVATTAPTGGNKQFTVDVQKGNQSTGFATILTAVVTYDSTKANRQVVEASLIADPSYADGDTIRIVVTASGSTGSQGQGLAVTLHAREAANP